METLHQKHRRAVDNLNSCIAASHKEIACMQDDISRTREDIKEMNRQLKRANATLATDLEEEAKKLRGDK
jgi:septal ring factor EnvC (AmiA/AmiB activator)